MDKDKLKSKAREMITREALEKAAQNGMMSIGNLDGWSLQLKTVRCGKTCCKKMSPWTLPLRISSGGQEGDCPLFGGY